MKAISWMDRLIGFCLLAQLIVCLSVFLSSFSLSVSFCLSLQMVDSALRLRHRFLQQHAMRLWRGAIESKQRWQHGRVECERLRLRHLKTWAWRLGKNDDDIEREFSGADSRTGRYDNKRNVRKPARRCERSMQSKAGSMDMLNVNVCAFSISRIGPGGTGRLMIDHADDQTSGREKSDDEEIV